MESRFQTAGWRSHWVWLGGLALFALMVAASWLGSGGCESITYPPNVVLPASFPWRLAAYLGGAAAMRVADVADVVGPIAGWLAMSLLIGALWSRVLRHSWALWALVLAPSLVVAVHLLHAGVLWLYWTPRPGMPEWVFVLVWLRFPTARYFMSGALFTLVAVGFVAVLLQKAWAWRIRSRGVAASSGGGS